MDSPQVRAADLEPALDALDGDDATLGLADLRALPLREVALPITCVEGWSATGRWRGVPIGELLERAGAGTGHHRRRRVAAAARSLPSIRARRATGG